MKDLYEDPIVYKEKRYKMIVFHVSLGWDMCDCPTNVSKIGSEKKGKYHTLER